MTADRQSDRILVVDDEQSVRDAYRTILEPTVQARPDLDGMEAAIFGEHAGGATHAADRPREVVYASQGREADQCVAEAVAQNRPFSVAFVDMRMPPGWDGIETIERIWKTDPKIEVVISTAYSDHSRDDIVSRLGRTDQLLLLKKPFDPVEVLQLATALAEKWRLGRTAERELAESRRLSGQLKDANSELEREVAERRAAEERLWRHAYYDLLTGLPNRVLLLERIGRCLEKLKRDPTELFAVLFLDLDSFKLVNDSLGHDMGDRLLVEVSRRLTSTLRGLDLVTRLDKDAAARLGGDEFVVVLEGIRSPSDAARIADRILQSITEPFDLEVQQVALSASVGIAIGDPSTQNADALLRDADMAMYRAKLKRTRIALFDPQMHLAVSHRLSLESDLRRALAANHLSLAFQPIVDAADGRIIALEALCRWDHPDYPARSPAEFIPVAEETGLIVPMGRWILGEACATLAMLRAANPNAQDLKMNVNVSRRQLLDPRLASDVSAALARTGVPANRLNLEITESAMMGDEQAAIAKLDELKKIGVAIHLDDFGTGYSSLACLQRFPLDVVKIDRAFIQTLCVSETAPAILEAIVVMAHRLGIGVTVEGVETQVQYSAIKDLKSDFAQGFLLHRPLPAASINDIFSMHAGRIPVGSPT